jgi:hypothetical protein
VVSPLYAVLGRADHCDVRIADPSVSARHARLSWQRHKLVLEDLGSVNGTWLDGQRVTQPTIIEIGQDVRLGQAAIPWDDDALGAFLRHGATDTIVAMPRFGRYRCPKCHKLGILPAGFKKGELTCTTCGTSLLFGKPERSVLGTVASVLVSVISLGLAAFAVWLAVTPAGRALIRGSEPGGTTVPVMPGVSVLIAVDAGPTIAASRTSGLMSSEERAIRDSGSAARVMSAIDDEDAETRNLAVQIASVEDGPFHVEQVAAIWMHVRAEFDYVNDPRGAEYFARASETIENGFAGDCDDFSTTLAAMTTAIGGRARVVIMDGDAGGHAYAEVCIPAEPEEVATRLRRFVRRRWSRRLGRVPSLAEIHHRSDTTCPVWLNLDWNVNYPGGPYGNERWAVAIETDGATETLAPATSPAD